VTERSKRDLTKRFDEMDVDWFLVERQLSQWSESFRAGRKLRVDVSFNYVEIGQPAPMAAKRAGSEDIRPPRSRCLLKETRRSMPRKERPVSRPSGRTCIT